MSDSALLQMLRKNLDGIEPPAGYDELVRELMARAVEVRKQQRVPDIKESPENLRGSLAVTTDR